MEFVSRVVAGLKGYVKARPAGLTAVASAVVVIVAKAAGVDLSETEAVGIVGILTGLVSHKSPRA